MVTADADKQHRAAMIHRMREETRHALPTDDLRILMSTTAHRQYIIAINESPDDPKLDPDTATNLTFRGIPVEKDPGLLSDFCLERRMITLVPEQP